MRFEICAVNIQSVRAARQAGAHRIELCSALDGGGLTPSPGLIRAACAVPDLPVHVLIRPREGNFCYDEHERAIMLDDVRFCRDAGVAGVVVGALDARGDLDVQLLEDLRDAAGSLDLTCHRAFDYTRDPTAALETLVALGFQRVLSSGQATTAYDGRFLLQKMVQQAAGRITVMPGAGISPKNIRAIAETTGATEFHLTGRRKTVQPNAGGDIPGLEWWFWESDESVIRATMDALR